VKRVHTSIDEKVESQRSVIQDIDRWRRTSIYRSYRSRRREIRSNHRWVSKDKYQREDKIHMKLSIWDFSTHLRVSNETGTYIHGSEKGKEWNPMGQRREGHGCIWKHVGIRL
jgi:hypothetical protein